MIALLKGVFLAADFPIQHVEYIMPLSSVCQVSVDRSAANLTDLPLEVRDFFCPAAFRTFSLSLYFANLITIYLGVGLLLLILMELLSASLIWRSVFFPRLWTFPAIISSNETSALFFSSSSSGTPIV